MIKIRNVSQENGIEYGKGEQVYHLFVNATDPNKPINISFRHNYSDGLAECLRKAANAVEKMGANQ